MGNRRLHLNNVINNFTFDEKIKNGLFLVDLPTGYGKTHAVLDSIIDIYKKIKDDKDKHIIYITPYHKNLPVKGLRERFKEENILDDFDKDFFYFKSNIEIVLETMTNENTKYLPREILKSEEFELLKGNIDSINKLNELMNDAKQDKNYYINKLRYKNYEKITRMEYEPKFRNYVRKYLKCKYRNTKAIKEALQRGKELEWLVKIYPQVEINNKKIIFMTTKKLMSRCTTIIAPSTYFYNTDIFNGSIIFMDEFDSSKVEMRDTIIDDTLKNIENIIDEFKEINAVLQTNILQKNFYYPSNKSHRTLEQNRQIINEMIEESKNIFDKYKLGYSFKSVNPNNTIKLFHDHRFHTVIDEKNKYINIKRNHSDSLNEITFVNAKPDVRDIKDNIAYMLSELKKFISRFEANVLVFAINYKDVKDERGYKDYSIEASIRTILNEIFNNEEIVNRFFSHIIKQKYFKHKKILRNMSFFDNGARIYDFEDYEDHDMTTQILLKDFNTTPESILLNYLQNNKIVGLSATATCKSVICNYSLDYLSNKLINDKIGYYGKLSDNIEDFEIIRNEYENRNKGYEKVNILVDIIDGTYNLASLIDIFENKSKAESIYAIMETKYGAEKNSINAKERIIKVLRAYKLFLTTSYIKSFLCITNKYSDDKDMTFNKTYMSELFDDLAKTLGHTDITFDNNVFNLNTDDFERDKVNLENKLYNGEKLFVMSVYKAIGAGQNLQYKIPKILNESLVKINDYDNDYKDFDAIYLEKPTFVIPYVNESMSDESLAEYIFDIEYLIEIHQLDTDDGFYAISEALKHHYEKKIHNSIYDKEDVKCAYTRNLVQAIGRISRTNVKNSNIHICVDKTINGVILNNNDDTLFSPELKVFFENIKTADVKDEEIEKRERNNKLQTIRANVVIRSFGNKDIWYKDDIDFWNKIRDLVLKNPTIDEKAYSSLTDFRNRLLYLDTKGLNIDKYYFKSFDDFNNVKISFDKNNECNSEVSENNCLLKYALKIPQIMGYFEKEKYATSIKANDYMINPVAYTNIYKGALGEKIGEFIFENEMGIKLDLIDDIKKFEKMDYKIKDKDIYIDFKYWQNHDFNMPEDAFYEYFYNKIAKCGGKMGLVINIFDNSNSKYYDRVYNEVRLLVVPGLYRIVNNNVEPIENIREKIRSVINSEQD